MVSERMVSEWALSILYAPEICFSIGKGWNILIRSERVISIDLELPLTILNTGGA